MEHPIVDQELTITSQMDFIVPLKQIGLITRAVLEAITLFYQPRRIIVVSSQQEEKYFNLLTPLWNVARVEFIAEETFFVPTFNLSLVDIQNEYNASREGDQREPGWWIQQLIKLGAASQIPNISDHYVVWDGDLVPTRRWRLCSQDSTGKVNYSFAILQGRSRSEFNTIQYAASMLALTGFEPLEPPNGGTFVAHHMIFNRKYTIEMLQSMIDYTESSLPWPLLIMSMSRVYYRFSEYKTYATYMMRFHPEDFHYHELSCFGEGGLRFREANEVVKSMLTTCSFSNGGLSYSQVVGFMDQHWKELSNEQEIKPAYVQLDHIYGLDGIDLNICLYPSTLSEGETEVDSISSFSQSSDQDSEKEFISEPLIPSALFEFSSLSQVPLVVPEIKSSRKNIKRKRTGGRKKSLPLTTTSNYKSI